ncbi:MAG: hypothetical protein K6E29_09430 [Cyanobacteria bacterium RUI128]|nr:hypothetical protein [Cyanobacteria bacterium RUI128]
MTNSIQIQVESEENIIQLENYPSVYDIVFSDEDNSSVSVNLYGDDTTFKIDLKSSDEVDTTIKFADSDAWQIAEEIRNSLNNYYTKEQSDARYLKHFVYNQAIPSDTWEIQHDLNKYCPRVTVIDSQGEVWYPYVKYVDNNNCIVRLIGQITGTAYVE